ncbi:MAG: type IV toxin-antitoxin system AbiEi family antitoxin domain-containing protein [Candidatus Marinimicrobia bacterium]|nr:type IV toxin-antitoxin system AbiEi family antitoxin domain-containing protein [Candidatus Neomarinimicrobiota bacterium]
MSTHGTQEKIVRALLKENGVIRSRDAKEKGVHHEVLRRMVANGKIQKIARGQYVAIDHEFSGNMSLAVVAKHVPHSVICLLSALDFHGIGTQNPYQVWIAMTQKHWGSELKYPPLKIVRYSEQTITQGIEEVVIEGVSVKVFNIPKTIVDCFKYRNKVGVDVAVEALREVVETSRCKISEFDPYAKAARVQNVMRPYIEALI